MIRNFSAFRQLFDQNGTQNRMQIDIQGLLIKNESAKSSINVVTGKILYLPGQTQNSPVIVGRNVVLYIKDDVP